jgi:hypothetical protein
MNTMNKQEINEFIEKMEEVGDVWTEEHCMKKDCPGLFRGN